MGEGMALADGNFAGMGYSFEKLLAVMEIWARSSVDCARSSMALWHIGSVPLSGLF